ncbi:fungal specific transcription factor domain-containing protein, partial [Colletotrichum incanum]
LTETNLARQTRLQVGFSMDSSRATACDLCRLRKVRCDKSVPCFNCRQAEQVCTFTGAGQKPKVPRQRVHISLQYEEKIDLLDKRLANIESLLIGQQNLRQCSCSQAASGQSLKETSTSTETVAPVMTVFDENDAVKAFEGSSSLRSQMAAARRLTESAAMDLGTFCYVNTVAGSHIVVEPIATRGNLNKNTVQTPAAYRSMLLPPTSAVINVLRQLKESPPSSFFVLRCFLPSSAFIDLCRNVYFSVDDYSAVDFIIVNSGLYYLFTEYFCPNENADLQKQHLYWGSLCRNALAAAVTSLSASLSARIENVQALILGSSHAIEMAKPWLAWRLICFAAQLCVAAGFHDESLTVDADKTTRDMKTLLFWHVFALEKTLALRVGRASLIRDCDINLPKDVGSLSLPKLWDTMVPFWIANASIHGKLYDLLYSRAAQSLSQDEIVIRADQLLMDLQSIEPFSHVSRIPVSSKTSLSRLEDVLAVSRKVMYYTTSTLISRAKTLYASTPSFSPDCVESARRTIDAHHECIPIINDDRHIMNVYLHWRVLQTPFIPVIVLFCNIMETQDETDLQRLKDFANSLERGAHLSPSAQEFCQICQDLNKIAQKKMETGFEPPWALVPSLSTFGLDQYFATNGYFNGENYRQASDLFSQDMVMMGGDQRAMDFL